MSAFDIVIRGGTVATASDTFARDVGIRGGRIAALGHDRHPAGEVIDATGKLVLPGGIDSHVHFAKPSGSGYRHGGRFESGTRSVAFVGPSAREEHRRGGRRRLSMRVPRVGGGATPLTGGYRRHSRGEAGRGPPRQRCAHLVRDIVAVTGGALAFDHPLHDHASAAGFANAESARLAFKPAGAALTSNVRFRAKCQRTGMARMGPISPYAESWATRIHGGIGFRFAQRHEKRASSQKSVASSFAFEPGAFAARIEILIVTILVGPPGGVTW